MLNEIFSLLEPITYSSSSSLRPLAREARMVITARSASTSTSGPGKTRAAGEESAQEIYQKAVKLLQDPILPVRAHGLLLLRQLVTPKPKSIVEESAVITDPALVPAILSIFLQSVQDDDSYIFLNAVQGLAAMVDVFGKDVLKGLVRDYSHGLETMQTDSMSEQDLDVRTRIGEALSTVIQRCGTALGRYGMDNAALLYRISYPPRRYPDTRIDLCVPIERCPSHPSDICTVPPCRCYQHIPLDHGLLHGRPCAGNG